MARTTKRLTKSGPKKPTKKVTCADCEHNGVGKCVTPTVIDSAHCCNQYEKKFDPYSVLKPVKSSNVLKMGWHNNIIYALFKGDKLYAFEGFTLETHGAILKSESIGKALYALGVKGKLLNA